MHMGGCTNDLSPNFTIWHKKNHGYGMHNLRLWSLTLVLAGICTHIPVPECISTHTSHIHAHYDQRRHNPVPF